MEYETKAFVVIIEGRFFRNNENGRINRSFSLAGAMFFHDLNYPIFLNVEKLLNKKKVKFTIKTVELQP